MKLKMTAVMAVMLVMAALAAIYFNARSRKPTPTGRPPVTTAKAEEPPVKKCDMKPASTEDGIPRKFAELAAPVDQSTVDDPRPLIKVCLYDFPPYTVKEAHLRLNLVDVNSQFDKQEHAVTYRPEKDLPAGLVDVTMFILYDNYYTSGGTWMFQSPWSGNPQILSVDFGNLTTSDGPSPPAPPAGGTSVTVVLGVASNPKYHLDPRNWRATHLDTGKTYHPSTVTAVHQNIFVLAFPANSLPEKNPYRYLWGLKGREGSTESTWPTGAIPPSHPASGGISSKDFR